MRTTILTSMFILVAVGFAFAQSESKAIKFAEFGQITQKALKTKLDSFFDEFWKDPTAQGYIMIYGTPKAIAARRRQITDSITAMKPEDIRITFVEAGIEKTVRTVMWIVPPGVTPPKP